MIPKKLPCVSLRIWKYEFFFSLCFHSSFNGPCCLPLFPHSFVFFLFFFFDTIPSSPCFFLAVPEDRLGKVGGFFACSRISDKDALGPIRGISPGFYQKLAIWAQRICSTIQESRDPQVPCRLRPSKKVDRERGICIAGPSKLS